jgi:sec-independent protein translocase protein TatA
MSGGELVLFGARKIPEFAKGLGQGIKEFKKASSTEETAPTTSTNNNNKPTTPTA